MAFGALRCTRCGTAWAVELRHARAACPGCRRATEVRGAGLLWQGATAREAQAAVAALGLPSTGAAGPVRPVPRHDSPLDAAAAKARGIENRSRRAEEVALWCTRLVGDVMHGDLVEALGKAGVEPDRAEREIVRMLACDYLMEPRAGHYRVLEGGVT